MKRTLIGAGNQQGGLDVSNLLKPALARGELRTIAATTWSSIKILRKDAALARRFQLVQVKEPTSADAIIIMRGLRAIYEKHTMFLSMMKHFEPVLNSVNVIFQDVNYLIKPLTY